MVFPGKIQIILGLFFLHSYFFPDKKSLPVQFLVHFNSLEIT